MKDRLKQIRLDAGLSQAAFAERIGVKTNYVYMIETGRREPSPSLVREICRQFAVREPWLRSGDGPMHYDRTPALDAADRVRRLLIDFPDSTAASVLSVLIALDPAGPQWDVISSLLRSFQEHKKTPEA